MNHAASAGKPSVRAKVALTIKDVNTLKHPATLALCSVSVCAPTIPLLHVQQYACHKYLTSWHILADCVAVDANVFLSLAHLGHSVEEALTQVVLQLAPVAALHIKDAPGVLLGARGEVTGGSAVVVLKAHGRAG